MKEICINILSGDDGWVRGLMSCQDQGDLGIGFLGWGEERCVFDVFIIARERNPRPCPVGIDHQEGFCIDAIELFAHVYMAPGSSIGAKVALRSIYHPSLWLI